MPEFHSHSFTGTNPNPWNIKNDISFLSSVYTTHRNINTESNKQHDQDKNQSFQSLKDENFDKFNETSKKQPEKSQIKNSILEQINPTQKQRQKNIYFNEEYIYLKFQQNSQKEIGKNQKKQQQNLNYSQPNKKFEDFTLTDIIQFPILRQQYLKRLQIQELKEQPQFKFIFKNSDRVFDIGYYYNQFIDDNQLQKQVIKTYNKKAWISPITKGLFFTYLFGDVFLDKYSPFKGWMKERYHFVIPFGIVLTSIYQDDKITRYRNQILKDQYSSKQFKRLIQKYLCQTQKNERQKILSKQIKYQESRKKRR